MNSKSRRKFFGISARQNWNIFAPPYTPCVARPAPTKPTDGEIDILRILWEHQPRTAREIQQAMRQIRSASTSSIVTRLNIMKNKGLVSIDAAQRPKLYTAAVARANVGRQVLTDLMNRLFEGSARQMVMQLVSGRKLTPHEVEQLECLREKLENEKR